MPEKSLLEINTPSFVVREQRVTLPSKDVLGRMLFDLAIEPIADIFNDKLDYT